MGYELLARNWRGRQGEIDLVVAREDVIVFCEVKARSGDEFGEPFEAVTASKQARIRRLAVEWLQSEDARRGRARDEVRFDVASVRGSRVEILEAAF
jgi:putative endonuclease